MIIRPFQPTDEETVVALWRACGLSRPLNDPHKDIARKMRVRPDMFLVAVVDGAVVGSVMAGYEGHRGWLNYVAVAPAHRHRGTGRALVDEAIRLLREAGCPKVNLQVFSGNHAAMEFYRSIGFAVDDVVSMGKRLEHD
jgi:ribosomal protein S18 acetylase RimI-like enzyme